MTDDSGRRGYPGKQSGPGRFDATIHPGRGAKDLGGLDDVPLDRLPDRYGRLRALVTAEECAYLLDLGYEVRLRRHHPIRPLDPELIATDESVQRWLDETIASVQAAADPKRRKAKRS